MVGNLLLVRHHQSEYNKRGLWTGLHNPHLDAYGAEKSREMSGLIEDFVLHHAFTSELVRTKETLAHMLAGRQVTTTHAAPLNERDYGAFAGKNKWEVQEAVGEAAFKKLRRSWDHPVPGGESLKMVYERAVPFYLAHISPHTQAGTVLVVGHGNTLRALIKQIESVSDEDIADIEMPFGTLFVYTIDGDGKMTSKEVRMVASDVPA